MEDDGFKLVTGKKAAKKGFLKTANGTHIRVDGDLEQIQKSMDFAKNAVNSTGLSEWLVKKLEKLEPSEFVILGNGHFDGNREAGAHQLALMQSVAQNFEAQIIFQDPVCSNAEQEYLKNEKLKVRKSLDAKIDIAEDKVTVLVIIHGEHEILSRFLEYNWKIERLRNLVVIGNDYQGLHWEVTRKNDHQKIDEWFSKCRKFQFPAIYEPHNTAFSDTVLCISDDDLVL